MYNKIYKDGIKLRFSHVHPNPILGKGSLGENLPSRMYLRNSLGFK